MWWMAAALAQDPAPATVSIDQHHYEAGVAALKQKDAVVARRELAACTERAPQRVDCHWELGWAYWLLSDWEDVVSEWETVLELQPDHEAAAEHILTARGHVKSAAALKAMTEGAPETIVRSTVPEGTTVRLRAVGDVMLGTDFPAGYLPPNDGADLLAEVEEVMADADLTFANLEGPLCDSGETKKCGKGGNCYAFRSPTRYGDHVAKAGVDLASTANNHAQDFGEVCRIETEQTLDQLGIAYSGRPGTLASVEANGLKIAMIGFHTASSGHNLNDHDAAMELISAVDKTHDIVIVSFHGGAEGSKAIHVPNGRETFYGENRGHLRMFTHAAIDAGADLILGHGPHVPRAMEVYDDRLIAYSLGNFATYGRFNLSGYLGAGLILEVEVDKDGRFVAGKIISTRQEGEGVPVMDPDGGSAALIRKLSAEDFPETGVVVGQDGSIGKR
ncbi:MAG: CapA family protein [Proteobacteria bacterium]|nr:CapA family protein [Pseudomonadota bacterium]MCP4916852.1 CapA family protein [Pseudomonadota bacterium]